MAKNKDAKVRLGADTTAFTREMKKASGTMTAVKSEMQAVGRNIAGAFAVGSIVSFARTAFMAYEEQERANKRLNFALRGNKEAFKELTDQAARLQSTTGVDETDIQQIQLLAVGAGNSTESVKKLVDASLALSSATGTDLQAAFMQISGTLNGVSGKLIPKLGTEFANLTTEQLKNGDVVDLLNKKYGNLAIESNTATNQLSKNWGELMEKIGKGVSQVVSPGIEYLNDLFSSADQKKANNMNFFGIRRRGMASGQTWEQYKKQIEEQNKAVEQIPVKFKPAEDATNGLANATDKHAAALKKFKEEADKWEEQQELDAILIDDKRKRMEELNTEFSRMVQLMTETRKPVFLPTVSDEEGVSDTPGIDTEKIFKTYQDNIEAAKNFTNDMNMILSGGLQEAGMVAAEAFADMLTGEGSPEDMFKAILDVFATFLKQMGAAILSYGIAMSAFKKAFTNPLAAIAAGIGLIVAGGVVSNLAQRGPKAQGMADGGIVPMGYPNDTYPAMLTSGERVIPPGKLGGLGEMITVTGVLRAGDLYISSERGKYLNQRKG